jgi:hypothetical protein
MQTQHLLMLLDIMTRGAPAWLQMLSLLPLMLLLLKLLLHLVV